MVLSLRHEKEVEKEVDKLCPEVGEHLAGVTEALKQRYLRLGKPVFSLDLLSLQL